MRRARDAPLFLKRFWGFDFLGGLVRNVFGVQIFLKRFWVFGGFGVQGQFLLNVFGGLCFGLLVFRVQDNLPKLSAHLQTIVKAPRHSRIGGRALTSEGRMSSESEVHLKR